MCEFAREHTPRIACCAPSDSDVDVVLTFARYAVDGHLSISQSLQTKSLHKWTSLCMAVTKEAKQSADLELQAIDKLVRGQRLRQVVLVA